MRKLLIIFIFFINFESYSYDNSNHIPRSALKEYSNIYNYIYSLAIIKNSKKIAHKYTSIVMKNSTRCNVNPYKLGRQIYVESHFKRNAKSHKSAVGLMQIIPKHHLLLLNDIPEIQNNLRYIKRKTGYSDKIHYKIYNLSVKKHLSSNETIRLKAYKTKRNKYINTGITAGL